jgi:CheY-like chemotaxis protein
MVWLFAILNASAIESFIVLTEDNNTKSITEKKLQYDRVVQTDSAIEALITKLKFQAEIKKVETSYILKVGPFAPDDALAMVYLKLKKSFPYAFILEETQAAVEPKPVVRTIEKKVYVEKEDESLWIAVFALAFIGIFFMFISSEQMKRLKLEHENMKSKHQNLEQKQHEVLSSMGENIQIIAKETMTHTHKLAEKVKETPFYADVEKVMDNENELLDVTGDLVKFLRLKSKKVLIDNEEFNFNHVLNEVAGLLNTKYMQNDTELIFDIDKNVPRNMFADSVHMGQILINLLEYFIQNSKDKEVKLEVSAIPMLNEKLKLRFQIDADVNIEDKETLFDSYYDEEARRYVGLGLYVAKELTYLMGGELLIKDSENTGSSLIFTLPMEEKNKEKRKYRLPDKGLVGKKILLVDHNDNSALATEKLFAYFKADVTVLSEEKFKKNIPDFSLYEIIALSNVLFNTKVLEILEEIKKTQDIKVISIDNLFTSNEMILSQMIDISLKKPLTQEYVFDTLVELYDKGWTQRSMTRHLVDANRPSLPVHSEMFKDTGHITLESFAHFKDAHILIVEDNRMNQQAIVDILGKSKLKLSIADNGQEAVDLLHDTEEKTDIIFMDINMPVMDGYSAAEIIRKNHRFNQTAIIFLSALTSEHEIEKMLDCGMNGYLLKPVQIGSLYTALAAFLDPGNISKERVESAETPLLQFDGLDIEDGLAHVGDNIIFYKQVLQEFVDAYAQSDISFERLVREQRYGQIKILCMEMKGLTGTIGAKKMHVMINEIHQYLIYKKPEHLDSYIEKYKKELARLNRDIERYLAL